MLFPAISVVTSRRLLSSFSHCFMLPLAGETKISYSKFGICDDRLDLLSGAARSRTPVVQFVCVFEFICSYFGRSTRN